MITEQYTIYVAAKEKLQQLAEKRANILSGIVMGSILEDHDKEMYEWSYIKNTAWSECQRLIKEKYGK